MLFKILSASEPARTATPIGKSASAFKLKPLALLATLDDERLLDGTLLETTELDDERTLELLSATLDGVLELDGVELDGTLELEGMLELEDTLEGALELAGILELDGAMLEAILELPPTMP